MKKILIFIFSVVLSGSTLWTGNGIYYAGKQGQLWDVKADNIMKVTNPSSVYRVNDINKYSAYVSNSPDKIGNSMENSFAWHNKSRLAYVKLFKVTPGQQLSFVFSKTYYVFFAEYDSDFKLVNDGSWMTTGDVCTLGSSTEWVVMVFRQVNGDLSAGGGQDTSISVSEISNAELNYVLFEPFTYTFNLNGGRYGGYSNTFTIKRLGVEKMTLPVPYREGYVFTGWKSQGGKIYKNVLTTDFVQDVFKNTTFTAQWEAIKADNITLDYSYKILERNCNDFFMLTASISPADAADKTVVYESSDETVAKVDIYGRVTAYNTGISVITATASSGVKAQCKVYVMGFDIILEEDCKVDQPYKVKIMIYNNGESGQSDRKHVILRAPSQMVMYRVGDEDTQYEMLAESSTKENSGYKAIGQKDNLINTTDSTTVYYKLCPKEPISKSGDYKGNISFDVIVK